MRHNLLVCLLIVGALVLAVLYSLQTSGPDDSFVVRPETTGLIGCFGAGFTFIDGETRATEVGFVYSDGRVVYHYLKSGGYRNATRTRTR